MRHHTSVLAAMVIFVSFFCSASAAHAWWNQGWQYRAKITFDTSASGAGIQENQSEVPVLIRLHSGNFNFGNAKEDGTDIRFISSDDQVLLKHHIERFDLIDEIALLWVKVPRLSGNYNLDYIWMYYGNADAMGGQDSDSTYDAGFAGVYHFSELEGLPQDSSVAGNHAANFRGGLGLPAVIGLGLSLNGGGDRMTIAGSPTLDFSKGFTVNAWIRIAMPQNDALLLHRGNNQTHFRIGVDGTQIYAVVQDQKKTWATERSVDLAPGTWHHVAVTAGPDERLILYMDGLEMIYLNMGGPLPAITGDLSIGGATDGDRSYIGEVDELQISSMARSQSWIRTAYASQGPDGILYTFGVEEMGAGGSGLPIFYLGTIFKNITLDGWVIIGLLVILAMLSWFIFLSKTVFLWLIGREDKKFVQSFEESHDILAFCAGDNGFENSALFRIYVTGCEALSGCLNNPEMVYSSPGTGLPRETAQHLPGRLKLKGLNAVKAALERGFVEQSKRLNQWIMVLTLAITGGPFLGLLGTVWGVMNTFAAMAEAGEANIMAIAPGVASALSTTVFGLIVAIPALFGYNILAGKIKNITADLSIFIDRFAVRVDELHGGA